MTARLDEVMARALAGDPDQIALEYEDRRVRWGYLADVARRLEDFLTAAGLDECAQVGFVPRNRPAFVAALMQLLAQRRTIIMVHAFQSPEAIAKDLATLNLPVVIADEQDWTDVTLSALAPGALGISLASSMEAKQQVRLVAGDPSADRSTTHGPGEESFIDLLTSGTTGTPKRASIRYTTVEAAILAGSVLDASRVAGEPGEPGTVNFPISNISGIYSLLPMVAERRLILLQEKFDLDHWLAFVRKYRPGTIVIPPAGVRMMLDRDLPVDALAGVQYVQVGTSAIDIDTHRTFEHRFGVPILLTYGATEFCGAVTTVTKAMHAKWGQTKFGTVGKPCGDNAVRIIDPTDDRILPANRVGIIEVKVPFLGDHFIRTTDLGIIDEDGFLFHRGRADGVIVRGGFKIMPASVERLIDTFPGVSFSNVVGVPDPRLGELPVAVIEMQPGARTADRGALDRHLRDALPATHIPIDYLFVDALPRTPSMKVDLRATRALARQRVEESSL
ncbi:fatty acid--CoA ligase family protein [Sphingobium sp. AS12]|uniref:class I adenylate-forming enzyme family protein n=1 Tax=Sphingobium sp. AS12 TaxID=2849495 RepID=UPI001C319238|nr:fatty acid--CoA ligase family protein [Sphingobium sp. AS12]MBV2149109.1 fatty acid--CoA ligase family protein [Sphingobium sp. AS12]